MAGLVELRPIIEVCDMETSYEGGGRRRDPWWRQTAARKEISATLENILAERRTWQWESGRCGNGRGGGEVTYYDSGYK